VVTHMGKGLVFSGQPRPQPKVPALLSFGGSPVFMPTSFNAELPNLAW